MIHAATLELRAIRSCQHFRVSTQSTNSQTPSLPRINTFKCLLFSRLNAHTHTLGICKSVMTHTVDEDGI